jgi:hypothetical protein
MDSINICQNGHIVKMSSSNRLKLPARGRSATAWRPCSPARVGDKALRVRYEVVTEFSLP